MQTIPPESKEELKSILVKVKDESENAGLKISIHKIKIMVYGPIICQIDVETMETVADFIFGGGGGRGNITANCDCSH